MIDPRETLVSIRARVDAATEGPWRAYGTVIDAVTGTGDCKGCSGLDWPAHEPSCYHSEVAGSLPQNAEFIAHSRTDLPALLDSLEAILDTHVEREWRPFDGLYLGSTVCDHCRRTWPCTTVTHITNSMKKVEYATYQD